MFVLTLLADSIRIPPQLLAKPTLTSVQTEIEKRYPNKIIVDVGLVICPYGPPLEIGDGILVPGDGGAHHQVLFQCVVFRPFVEEVLVGTVKESHEGGVVVSVGGFFDYVFIPAYWMLNPSRFDEASGLWVWTPTYDDDDDEEEEKEDEDGEGSGIVKQEEGMEEPATKKDTTEEGDADEEEEEATGFQIEIGSVIRFKVKAVNFTRITTTMKGVQATTSTTSHTSDRAFGLNGSGPKPPSGEAGTNVKSEKDIENGAVRRRSSSADLTESANHPAPMQIVGSICEDGLGLLSWWKTVAEEEEDGEEEEEEAEEDGLEEEGGG
mmetsp:Transcript_25486/g.54852  ORF Transcript_25486/g.54852 Transcript_25486/m.54852 type:complete len:323 (-) Transcript_25486:115-1083(-)|eukprot:CAMPEP_0172311540 /NCGR_PEP_ID=MMETSP1058-20130122/15075_1 /TAXON_ID=83371 /ORGANISM="Detonula confervacea, Strain CCMP 353" /LENGTH=322 /DNA_ID=CAMNT_0013024757 /DNA_START=293 /DNA_END=1261 /DNA_ORIENTATION=-